MQDQVQRERDYSSLTIRLLKFLEVTQIVVVHEKDKAGWFTTQIVHVH